ncbi:T9SS type A sorting domain-containing protein [Taibaiella lutea]|uniref:T9SS type A sorting domain-containing protein n=2 Tax=Taibaiella lutea TaxID=2608001 RepID=A0A5M6CEN5_9BACT|nr:T9SS type A sorting domain-containing protein [Taibaiella lutea]
MLHNDSIPSLKILLMLSKYFRLSLFLMMGILHFHSYAQNNLQNLLDQMQDKEHGGTSYWIEHGNYYYFVSCQKAGPYNSTLHGWASQYFLNKYDKNTLQRLDQKYLYGDTLNSDSITFATYIGLKDKQFYLFYTSQAQHGNTVSPYYYFYQRIDIHFNTLVPVKRIEDSAKIDFVFSDCLKPMDNGNFFVGYRQIYNPALFPWRNHLILDSMGNTISNARVSETALMRGFTPLGNHTYLVSGNYAAGSGSAPGSFGWCLVNDSMQTLDTFNDKYGAVQDPVALSYFFNPGTIVLPGGSLISASATRFAPGSLGDESNYPLIRKHTAATRYGIDKFVVSGPLDNTDTAHESIWMPVSVAYNPYDHTIYYASTTHHLFFASCAANSDKGYLEVISLDTNLNIKWKKYFKTHSSCSTVNGINSPYERSGIILTGYDFFLEDNRPLYDWTYYINDATISDTLPLAVTEPESAATNNFKVYPNPANDIIQISVENTALKSVTVYDMTGRILFTKSLSKQEESIDIHSFGKGIYLLKCEDKNGQVFMSKVMKE